MGLLLAEVMGFLTLLFLVASLTSGATRMSDPTVAPVSDTGLLRSRIGLAIGAA